MLLLFVLSLSPSFFSRTADFAPRYVHVRFFFIFARRWRRRRLEAWEFRKRQDARLTSTGAERIVSRICRNVHPSSAGVQLCSYLMLIARSAFSRRYHCEISDLCNSALRYHARALHLFFYRWLHKALPKRGSCLLHPDRYNRNQFCSRWFECTSVMHIKAWRNKNTKHVYVISTQYS